MKRPPPSSIFLVLVSAVFFVVQTLPARAQAVEGIGVQPAFFEERIEPGQEFSSVLKITNLGPGKKTFYLFASDISGLGGDGSPIFATPGETTGYEISSWVSISSEPLAIGSGETKHIPFTIKVPRDASPGGHYGGIFVSLKPVRPETSGAGVGYQVGALLNFRIAGNIIEEALLREFRTDKGIYSRAQAKFFVRVENLGNVLIRPRGPLTITNFFGKEVTSLRMNDTAAAVFPKGIREFETSWEGGALAAGRYQAVLGLVYGEDGRKTISATLSFWVIPLHIIIPIAIGIVALILVALALMKVYIRKKVQELVKTTEASGRQLPGEAGKEPLGYQKNAPFARLALLAIAVMLLIMFFLFALFILFA